MSDSRTVLVVGLGYVGLPLACALARNYRTIGYDFNSSRVADLADGYDRNGSVSADDLAGGDLTLSSDPAMIRDADVVIVSVPTPVTEDNRPDLDPVKTASETVGDHLSPGTIVVFESTVYPGVTEEICAPIIESRSGLKLDRDFAIGYSPERINPGDGLHSLRDIVKIVAARDAATLDVLAEIYGTVTGAGVHRASSIRVAEAAKVIENVQRDVNIALVNELAMLFHRMGIDTSEVLDAAGTKWNFGAYRPGLVGGHCIPVDPYYLSHCAEELGYNTEIILAGRRTNNFMAGFIAQETLGLISGNVRGRSPAILVLGIAYKPNVPDPRNSMAFDLVEKLTAAGARVDVHDPLIHSEDIPGDMSRLMLDSMPESGPDSGDYDAIIVTVPHDAFKGYPVEKLSKLLRTDGGHAAFIDVTSAFERGLFEDSGIKYWAL